MKKRFLRLCKVFRTIPLILVVGLLNLFSQSIPQGALNGKFTVNDNGDQVYFSKGNLQYIGSANSPYWKFAEHQWDYLGSNGQSSTSQNVDRDLFGWGTSGYNHGANCYQPWSTIYNNSDYYAYGSSTYNLNEQTGKANWGYNSISNGGNTVNQWRTLSVDEWKYVFKIRTTSSGIRYAKARVNSVNGVVLLPDNWNSNTYSLSNTNTYDASFNSNVISASQWTTLENAGAIFLPAAGYRYQTSVYDVGSNGYYWSSSYEELNCDAYLIEINNLWADYNATKRGAGQSVRLVYTIQTSSYSIDVSPNPAEGGTVTGGGTYQESTICTLTANANDGYVFIYWTENGNVVSIDATYSFTVNRSRNIVANFVESIDGHGYVDLGLPSGVLWAVCNVGANTPLDSGNIFAWGVNQPNSYTGWNQYLYCNGSNNTLTKYCTKSNYGYNGFTDNLTILLPNDDAATVTWGANWRMPTQGEYQELINNTTYSWTTLNGVNGMLFTSSNGNSLFLPAWDKYWSRSLVATIPNNAYGIELYIDEDDFSYCVIETYERAYGHYIRAIRTYEQACVINVSASPTNCGMVSGGGTYQFGTVCTLVATANVGYRFVNWTKNGEVVSTDALYSFTVIGDATYKANFEIYTCEISAWANPANFGAITIESGSAINNEAEVDFSLQGYTNAQELDGTVIELDDNVSVTLHQNNAQYPPRYYDIGTSIRFYVSNSLVVNTTSGVIKSIILTYGSGDGKATISTDVGEFDTNTWTGSNESVVFTIGGTGGNRRIHSIEVVYGDENGSSNNTFVAGSTCVLTAIPNAGYEFVNWTKNGIEVSTETEYSFVVVEDAEYVANFEEEVSVIYDYEHNLIFTVNEDRTTVTLTGHLYAEFGVGYPDVSIEIPSTVTSNNHTYTVTAIGNDVFMNFSNLVSITIPNTVTIIGSRAFYECTGLNTITIPSSVTTIESYALAYCSGLKNIIVLATTPPNASFDCVSSNISLLVPAGALENYTFTFCPWSMFSDIREDHVINFADDNVKALCVENWDTNGDGEIYLSESYTVTSLSNNYGGRVFSSENITSFDELQYFMGLDAIEKFSFENCTNLSSITIPSSISLIGRCAFLNCSGLTTITVLPYTPPIFEDDSSFSGVDKTIPCYVPCGSLDLYQNASGWSEFTNYQCMTNAYITINGYGSSTDSDHWVFIASPLASSVLPAAVDGLVADPEENYDLYRFNQSGENGEWENYKGHTAGFVLENGKGYLYANKNDVTLTFAGAMIMTASQEVELYYDGTAKLSGWNLVGNPLAEAAYIDRPYYMMNATGTNVTPVETYGTTPVDAYTGIMVHAETSGESVTFTKSGSKSSDNGGLQITLSKACSRGDEAQDKVIVSFNKSAQLSKFIFNEDNAKLYIPMGGEDYAIAYSDRQSNMPLYFKTKEMGIYTMSFEGDIDNIKIIDNIDGSVIDLNAEKSFTFVGTPSDRNDRFTIVFNTPYTDDFAYQSGEGIVVNGEGELQVFDIMGRTVAKYYVNGLETVYIPCHSGVYVLRLLGKETKTQKIVVK